MAPRISFKDQNVEALLTRIGLSEQAIMDCNDVDLDTLVPSIITQAELVLLKVAKRNQGALFDRYYRVVGRLEVTWVSIDGEDQSGQGTCVLCAQGGVVVTALHNVQVDDSKARIGSVKVSVILANTIKGRFRYAVEVIKANEDLDLALLKPVNPNERHDDLEYFSQWSSHAPSLLAKAYLISYPAVLDTEFPSRIVKGDLPTLHEGRIAYVEDNEAVATYMGLAGCSGGLVLCFNADGYASASGIHIGIVHESKILDVWDESQLGELNAMFSHKAAYGHYTYGVAKFLESFVLKAPKPSLFERKRKNACHQVAFSPKLHSCDMKGKSICNQLVASPKLSPYERKRNSGWDKVAVKESNKSAPSLNGTKGLSSRRRILKRIIKRIVSGWEDL